MSVNRYIGNAPLVAMVVTITVTGYDATTTYKVTMNGKVVSVLGSGGSTTTVATALTVALVASAFPEFAEVTWTSNAAVITGTATNAGVPFVATSSVSGGAGTIGAVTTTVANSGPSDVSIGNNYLTGAVFANGEDAFLQNLNVPLLYNLGALSAVVLNSLTVDQNFTAAMGLPAYNVLGYAEYRATYFAIQSPIVTFRRGAGSGSGRLKHDAGSATATTWFVDGAGQPAEQGLPAVLLKGTNAANIAYVTRGSVGFALFAGETAVLATLDVGYQTNRASDAVVSCGSGVTLTTIKQVGGLLNTLSGSTTITQEDGTSLHGAGNITTLNVRGKAYATYSGAGTIATTNVTGPATMDLSTVQTGCVLTNVNLYPAANWRDDNGRATYSNGFTPVACGLEDLGTVRVGKNRKLTPA